MRNILSKSFFIRGLSFNEKHFAKKVFNLRPGSEFGCVSKSPKS